MSRWRSTLYDKVVKRGEFSYVELESGRLVSFWDAMKEAERGKDKCWRWLARVNKLADNNYDLERYEWFLDDIETLLNIHRKEIEKRRGGQRIEERIALLRNTTGRSEREAAIFLAKADELERKHGTEKAK